MSYQGGTSSDYADQMRKLPYKIIPGEEGVHNQNIFLERAIVSERIRLAMGLPLRPINEQVSTTEGLEHSVIADKYVTVNEGRQLMGHEHYPLVLGRGSEV